jgi:hypothetical protein
MSLTPPLGIQEEIPFLLLVQVRMQLKANNAIWHNNFKIELELNTISLISCMCKKYSSSNNCFLHNKKQFVEVNESKFNFEFKLG